MKRYIEATLHWLLKPIPSWPLDLLRIALGALGFIYFSRILYQFELFTSNFGLVDHSAIREVFWFTWLPLLDQANDTTWLSIIILALIACCSLMLGILTQLSALIAFLTSVLLYRHNFAIMYVDDAIMHIAFFWLMLSPIGSNFTIIKKQKKTRPLVSGFILRCMGLNLSLLYLVAGLSKWSSPMWQDGTALAAVLRSGAGWWQDALPLELLPLLKILTWSTLLLEPLFSLIPLMTGTMQRVLTTIAISFHLGIIATLDVAFANLVCIAILLCYLTCFKSKHGKHGNSSLRLKLMLHQWELKCVAAAVLFLLSIATPLSLAEGNWRKSSAYTELDESGKGIYKFSMGGLWLLGIAQQYRLFDWIDQRNYHVEMLVTTESGQSRSLNYYIPRSTRSALLYSYTLRIPWAALSQKDSSLLQEQITERLVKYLCHKSNRPSQLEVEYKVTRIHPNINSWGTVQTGTLFLGQCDH